jgi:hypothetical protein
VADVLSAAQRANKVKNLLQAMRRAGLVHARGPRALAVRHLGQAGDVLDNSA